MRKAILHVTAIVISLALVADVMADDRALKRQLDEMRSEKRVALVIGNSNYKSASLKNPVNDARLMARTLKGLGFEVIELTNANQKQMKIAVDQFGKRIKNGGVALFYYAGHGMQVGGRNFLIPVGADISVEQDVEYESIDAGRVLGKMEAAGNRLNIVMLDACRNNPYARSFRSAEKGLATVDAPKGSFIAYATSPGSVAADGSGSNGIFTSEIVRAIKTEGLEIDRAFRHVRAGVMQRTGDKQVPWTSSSLVGDFYFQLPKGGTLPAQQVAIAPRQEAPKPVRRSDPNGTVFVKGGCFQMGGTFGGGRSDEKPVHEVCVGDFYMDKTEVTQAAYREQTGKSPSKFKNCDDCPVEYVSWNEAKAYCEKTGKRLPTEAEWEYAARSGGKKEKYAGTSGKPDAYAWYGDNSGRKTHPVAQKRANGLGLYDMSGNVWEWVADWYDESYYRNSPRNNPQGPGGGKYRVLRGGGWGDYTDLLRVSYRFGTNPTGGSSDMGFRCAGTP